MKWMTQENAERHGQALGKGLVNLAISAVYVAFFAGAVWLAAHIAAPIFWSYAP